MQNFLKTNEVNHGERISLDIRMKKNRQRGKLEKIECITREEKEGVKKRKVKERNLKKIFIEDYKTIIKRHF